ncbi:MAG: hypothetical protein K6F00_02345 [Lachnospiraceae bacterium]|nr:hypothetical protein [Lachnospiraceae bacterium]
MRRRMNPIAVIVLVVVMIAAFAAGALVKNILPDVVGKFSNFIFWSVVIVVGAGGSLLVGRFLNK